MGETQAYLAVANHKFGGCADDLRALLQEVASDARIKVHSVSGEPPTTLRIEASPPVVETLRRRFGNKVIIEADSPLRLM
jgi:hypothetical protein